MKFTKRLTTLTMAGSLVFATGAVELASVPNAVAASASTMTVKAGITLNVRSGPGTGYSTKGNVAGGTAVTGTSQGNGWFRLASGPYSGGYVSESYLSSPPAPSSTPSGSNGGPNFSGYVSKTLIRTLAHSAPSSSCPIKGYLKPGTRIQGQLVGDWLKTTSGDYVSRALITTTPLRNGALPASRLCNVPVAWNSPGSWAPGYTSKTVRRLDCYALKSLTGLENAYHAQFGRFARIDLAYRPFAEQQYWYKKFGYPRAAVPGTSNHGLGVAVDFRETDVKGEEFGWGGTGYTWLKKNGSRWGFWNTFSYGQKGESYHWDFEGKA